MTTPERAEREAFEALMLYRTHSAHAPRIVSHGAPCEGEYADSFWQSHWETWQAARATQPPAEAAAVVQGVSQTQHDLNALVQACSNAGLSIDRTENGFQLTQHRLAEAAQQAPKAKPAALSHATVDAFVALFEAVVTRADKDYMQRQLIAAEKALRAVRPWWESPVPPQGHPEPTHD